MALLFRDTSGRERYGFVINATCILIFSFISILLLTTFAHAQTTITGKVISIADGDTITVLQDRTQYKIRLYGIDCPESHQDFGTRAKQFVSDLVFNKDVTVIQKDMDRYGKLTRISIEFINRRRNCDVEHCGKISILFISFHEEYF